MKNLQYSETRFTIGYIGTLTGTKPGDSHDYQKCDGKTYCTKLSDVAVITGSHENVLNLMQLLNKSFQVSSGGEARILKKNQTKICFDKKMVNIGGE